MSSSEVGSAGSDEGIVVLLGTAVPETVMVQLVVEIDDELDTVEIVDVVKELEVVVWAAVDDEPEVVAPRSSADDGQVMMILLKSKGLTWSLTKTWSTYTSAPPPLMHFSCNFRYAAFVWMAPW